eukprot:ANDGO_07335.mRNA.1 putative threonine--tRNA ligase 1
MAAVPGYISDRVSIFERLWAEHEKEIAAAKERNVAITITLPDGSAKQGIKDVTTPLEIAAQISKKLGQEAILAHVVFEGDAQAAPPAFDDDATDTAGAAGAAGAEKDAEAKGIEWDVQVPLPASCKLTLFTYDSEEGKEVFWHSSSHLLGAALEAVYPDVKLNRGPPLEDGGFFYEGGMSGVVREEDFAKIEKYVEGFTAGRGHPFQRLLVKKSDAVELFKYNPYKMHILTTRVADDGFCTVYRCGSFVDPCKGPHIPATNLVRAFKVTKNSAAYWLNDATKDSLQRVYGISFPQQKMLKEWITFQEEAAKRDHRKIGKDQELFFFHNLSPGSCFWLPHGGRIYDRLMDYIKGLYRVKGFDLVVTPNVYNVDLWKQSGHWQNYQEHMFAFEVEKEVFALKPMNCPGHCLMFAHRTRSWRELPIRFADFGVLHRNEFSGALSGLTRVRRFQQDDAHIFCMSSQITSEIRGALQFMKEVYGIFGLGFELRLSTRPAKFLGDVELWNRAEDQLREALGEFGEPWSVNPGDGAFYGPKIDVTVLDALKRKHQCATIQLDFQLPIRFNLEFQGESSVERPVMIHRAIFGSVERFIAVLTEHTAGKWPFWVSPRQVILVPVSEHYLEYAMEINTRLLKEGFWSTVDTTDRTLSKKVREAQLSQHNFILVVGKEELEAKTVNVRTRDNVVHGSKTIDDLVADFKQLCAEYK